MSSAVLRDGAESNEHWMSMELEPNEPGNQQKPVLRPIRIGEFVSTCFTRRVPLLERNRIRCSVVNDLQCESGDSSRSRCRHPCDLHTGGNVLRGKVYSVAEIQARRPGQADYQLFLLGSPGPGTGDAATSSESEDAIFSCCRTHGVL